MTTSAHNTSDRDTDSTAGQDIRFLLDDRVVSISGVAPTKSVLNYLRENLRRTGTKEGCAEGDCGACTVVIAELDGDQMITKTVNACLQFLPALDGKALFTVESLRGADGTLHPAQRAMVDCHGSQCGFCTPGFVMSLWNVYVDRAERDRPTDREVRTALTGNLCRCTGYRPIIEAGQRMFDLPRAPFDRPALRERLLTLRRGRSLDYASGGQRYAVPRTLCALLALRTDRPAATLVAGNTDVGLWVNKQLRELDDIIHVGEVDELKAVSTSSDVLRIGAAATLETAYRALARHYPELIELWERFASPPIRNAGTLGGNVANGSPIGDSMPALIALGARVELASVRGTRTMAMEDFYLGYQKKALAADEIVAVIEVPLPTPGLRFRTYKVSKRYDSDISAVCAAFALQMDGARIASARIAFGGMAAVPKRATGAEAALAGQDWSEVTLARAITALAADYTPLSDMRAGAGYRSEVAGNLLRRFFLETRLDAPLAAAQVSVFAAE